MMAAVTGSIWQTDLNKKAEKVLQHQKYAKASKMWPEVDRSWQENGRNRVRSSRI